MKLHKNLLRDRFANGVGVSITYNPTNGERFIKSLFNALNKTNTDRAFVVDDVMQKLVAYFDKTNLDFFSTETGGNQPDLELRQIGVVYRHSPNEVPTMELNSDEKVWSEEERESYIGQMKRFAMNGYADCENGIFYTYVYGWFNKEKEDYEHIFFISNDAEPKTRSSHYKTLVQKLSITRSTGFNHFFKYRFSIYYAPQLSSVLDFLDLITKEVVATKLKSWVDFNSQQFIAGYDASKNKDKYTTRYPNLPQDRQSNEFKEVVNQNSLNLIYKAFMRSLGNYLLGSSAKNKTMLKVMAEYLYELYLDDFNITLMEEYDRVQKSDYAKSFETKRNIPTKIQAAMDSTKFLEYGFGFVEFDEQFDLEKLPDIEEQWGLIHKALPHSENKPELRFRKIEHRKAHGVYFPAFDCITISVRNVNSMLHEYGHHIDFTYDKDQNLSMSDEFRPILKGYQRNLSDGGVYKGSMLNYFLTPTEVFARAFEIYCVTVLPRVSFTESLADYDNKFEYLWLINNTEEVLNYFDTKFPHIREEVAKIQQNEKSPNLTNLTEDTQEEELAPNQVKAGGFTVTIEETGGKSELEGKELIPVGRDVNGILSHEIVEKPSKQAEDLYNGISISDEILEDGCLTEFAFLLDPISFSDGTKFGGVVYLVKDSKGVIYHTFRVEEPHFSLIETTINQLHDECILDAEKSYMTVGDLLHNKIKKYGISVHSLTKGIASLRFADFKDKDFGLTEEYQVHQVNRLFGELAKSYANYLEKLSHRADDKELKALFKQKAHEEIAKDFDISREVWNFDSVLSEYDEAIFVEHLPNNKDLVKKNARLVTNLFIYLYPNLGGSHADYMSDAVFIALVNNDLSVSLYLTDELKELVKAKINESALNPQRAFDDLAKYGLDLTIEV